MPNPYRFDGDDDYDGPDTSGPDHECRPILNGICGCSCHDLEDCGCECCRWNSDDYGDDEDDDYGDVLGHMEDE